MKSEDPDLPEKTPEATDGEKLSDSGPSEPAAAENQVGSGDADEFFHRLRGNLRWPKPDAAAVAAAVEAVQRMSSAVEGTERRTNADRRANQRNERLPGNRAQNGDLQSESDGSADHACPNCAAVVSAELRFCGQCGTALEIEDSSESAPERRFAQHHYHHHYHHFVGARSAPSSPAPANEAASPAPRGLAPGSPGISRGGRAEAGARQVIQDWAQACNTKHVDDLVELYSADAMVVRSSVPPVRSLPAIREFLVAMLEAGLGDVEMESIRLEVMGDVALDIGRCKMLVPVAMGKRREERGKYMVVLVKQPVGTWKILADCWSSDLNLSAPQDAVQKKANEPLPAPRKQR